MDKVLQGLFNGGVQACDRWTQFGAYLTLELRLQCMILEDIRKTFKIPRKRTFHAKIPCQS